MLGNSSVLQDDSAQATRCLDVQDTVSDLWCPRAWDGIHCWPPAPPDTLATESCDVVLATSVDEQQYTNAVAFRMCNSSGMWEYGTWTNYSQCLDVIAHLEQEQGAAVSVVAVRYITFVGSLASLLTLLVSLFIFTYFRSLECDRLRVHRNLLVALMLQFIAMMVIVEPYITNRTTYTYIGVDWLCRALLSMKLCGQVATIMWMFVEGLFLHSRLTCNVFDSAAPFKFYYCIGWVLPFAILGSWCAVMTLYHKEHCWRNYSTLKYIWIIEAPMLFALLVNFLFLINIIRILVTKLRCNYSAETVKVRKAIRATVILFQVLGITNLLVAVNPGPGLEAAYMLTNAVLQSSQGVIVSTMYCFLNSEVRDVFRKKWRQYLVNKMSVHQTGRTLSSRRSESYYQHRKNTFSTIVLSPSLTNNQGENNFNLSSFSEFNSPSRRTMEYKSFQPQQFNSFRYGNSQCRKNVSRFSTQYCASAQDLTSSMSEKRQWQTDKIINQTKIGDNPPKLFQETCPYTGGNRLGVKFINDYNKCINSPPKSLCCNVHCSNNVGTTCLLQTVCSNESCQAEPCKLSSCVFTNKYDNTKCEINKKDQHVQSQTVMVSKLHVKDASDETAGNS